MPVPIPGEAESIDSIQQMQGGADSVQPPRSLRQGGTAGSQGMSESMTGSKGNSNIEVKVVSSGLKLP